MSPRPVPVFLALAAVGAMAVVAVQPAWRAAGEPVFPLDDAYIHLALAKTLATTGTWGIEPGQFASASSSPAWSALLALGMALGSDGVRLALALNAGAVTAVIALAARLLKHERGEVTGATLVALATGTPLVFVAALGMEHGAHLAGALVLLGLVEPKPPRPGRAVLAAVAGAVVTLIRYETIFLLAGLVVAWPRRRAAWAAVGGAVTAVVGFGTFSALHGAAWLPNPLLKKAWVARNWAVGWAEAWREGASVWALVLVAVVLVAVGVGASHRRRLLVFCIAATGQLVLGRIGWFYRYEAWLVGLGIVSVLPPLAALFRRGPRVVAGGLLVCLGGPLASRAAAAVTAFPAAVQNTFDTNVTLARWLAAELPDAALAVHDLGAIAWIRGGPLVDAAGLGTDAVAELDRQGSLDSSSMSRVLAEARVHVAVSGERWTDDARPSAFVEVGRLLIPYPVFPGVFPTVLWSDEPEASAHLADALARADGTWDPRVDIQLASDIPLDLSSGKLSGAVVKVEPQGLAFYTDGSASWSIPESGALRLYVSGTPAGGRSARLDVRINAEVRTLQTRAEGERFDLGTVRRHDLLRIELADDLIDEQGGDRNVLIRSLSVRPVTIE